MDLDTRDFIRYRWPAFISVEKQVQALGNLPVSAAARGEKLRPLEADLLRLFPCRAAAAAFWSELRFRPGAHQLLDGVLMIAADVATSGSALGDAHNGRREPPILRHLRLLAEDAWVSAEREEGGFSYVVQQDTREKVAPHGQQPSTSISTSTSTSMGRPWTSTPRWAADIGQARAQVQVGWRAGQARWAVSIGSSGEEPQFLYGLDAEGCRLAPAEVDSIIRSTVSSFDLPASAHAAFSSRLHNRVAAANLDETTDVVKAFLSEQREPALQRMRG